MKRVLPLVFILSITLLSCTDDVGSYRIRVVFPDARSRESVDRFVFWVFNAEDGFCSLLLNGSLDPLDLTLVNKVSVSMSKKEDTPMFENIPSGELIFYGQGLDRNTLLLHACVQTEVRPRDDLRITFELASVCSTNSVEIACNDQDDDCDGLIDECISDQDCQPSNPCIGSACLAGFCDCWAMDGNPCDDGIDCSGPDICQNGVCTGPEADSDNDQICDPLDMCRGDDASGDTDGDAICNDLDTDDDGDGFSDSFEINCDSNPLMLNSIPDDSDEDGSPDCIDGCPDDATKTEPGVCGCSKPEESCAGEVVCWGRNGQGQANPPSGMFVHIALGGFHGCGIRTDGTAVCWGANSLGQSNPPDSGFVSIAAGIYHSCGIQTDGTGACWGLDIDGNADTPSGPFILISAGDKHTCGLRDDGIAQCWGGDNEKQSSPPGGIFAHIDAGAYHTCGLRYDGTGACWGNNKQGQASPPAVLFSEISAGNEHTCGIQTNGTLRCWGTDEDGESSPPAGMFVQLSAGFSHSCGLQSDRTAVCWGDSDDGESYPPARKFLQVAAGYQYSCGIVLASDD